MIYGNIKHVKYAFGDAPVCVFFLAWMAVARLIIWPQYIQQCLKNDDAKQL